jgi:tetratricopeptide (TPR) repeat protein
MLARSPGATWAQLALGDLFRASRERDHALAVFQAAQQWEPGNSQAWLKLGLTYGDLGDVALAQSAYEQASRLAPADPGVLVSLADLLQRQDQPDRALAYLQQATQVSPASGSAHTSLGSAYLIRADRTRALAEYLQAVSLEPQYVSSYMQIAALDLLQGRSDAALAECAAAGQVAPNSGWPHSATGNLYLAKNRLTDALGAYTAALKREVTFSDAWVGRGNVYRRQGQAAQAMEAYQAAVDADPLNGWARVNVATQYQRLAQFKESVAQLQRAAEKIPDSQQVHQALLQALRQLDRAEELSALASQAIADNPGKAWPYLLSSDANSAVFQPDAALRANEKAARLEPGSVSALLALGWAYQIRGNLQAAEAQYQEAYGLEPGNAEVLKSMASGERAQGNREASIDLYERAADLNTSSGGALMTLAQQYRLEGDLELSRDTYQLAIQREPANPWAYTGLAQVTADLEDNTAAIDLYLRAGEIDRSAGWPYLLLGNLYLTLKDYDSAESAYREALAREPGNVNGYTSLGTLLVTRGLSGALPTGIDDGRALFQQAADLFPGAALAWDRVGYGYQANRQSDEAIASYQHALRLDPTRVASYDAILIIYRNWGPLQNYLSLFQDWKVQQPDQVWPTGLLARAYQKLDYVDDAIREYEAVLARVPSYMDAHYQLANLYERASRRDDAIREWNIYLTLAVADSQQFQAEDRLLRLSQIVITSPQAETAVKGSVEVRGTASLDAGLNYYKLEYQSPDGTWHLVGDLHYEPVIDGPLGVWDVSGLAPGRYQLRLVVVDQTGNFLPPFEIWVNVGK